MELIQSHVTPSLHAVLNVSDDDDLHPSEDWLGAIARGTMETYVTNIFRIPSLTETSAHQLAADIGTWYNSFTGMAAM